MTCVIYIDPPADGERLDEKDSLEQARAILESLGRLGAEAEIRAFSEEHLKPPYPDFVFNLVESERDGSRLAFAVPAILEARGIPCTGGSSAALRTTTSKIEAKKLMDRAGIPTPAWFSGREESTFPGEGDYIIKPMDTDASIDLDEDSVVRLRTAEEAERELSRREAARGRRFFAERYLEGREFNLSLLEKEGVMTPLAPAEMVFRDYDGRRKVLGYRAKWETDSFESRNTLRSFPAEDEDRELLDAMKTLSLRCARLFGLGGYARVDFRCDESGVPFVLEINQNPCLSSDAGFAAAALESGIGFDSLVGTIATEALKRKTHNGA